MPQAPRQAHPTTHAMTSNTTPGTCPPSSACSESRQRAGEGGGPFDFMAKVPSPVIPPPATPDASAAGPASTVCNNFYLLFRVLTYILIMLGSITGLSHQPSASGARAAERRDHACVHITDLCLSLLLTLL